MTPIICMVTDRRRAGGDDMLVRRVSAAAAAGVHLVQVRERDLDGGPLTGLVERCVAAVRGTRTRILVNDRVDVALAAGAHGVHLRGDSIQAARVRAAVPAGFVIGRSVHTIEEVRDATAGGGLDYLIFGPVWPTASKPGHAGLGLNALADAAAATTLPVLAIGGINSDNAIHAGRAGAAGYAAISLFDTLAPLT